MTRKIRKAAVLGSGVMGSAIAAHFANVGVPCLLLDLPAADGNDPDAVSRAGLENARKAKPAAFYLKEGAALIETGNFDTDLARLAECDLAIEVIVERMEVKKAFLAKVDKVRRPGTILASNTSGLSVNEMVSGCSEDLRRHFLGMHFFNPPRYLKLLEVIPTRETEPEVVEFIRDFGENVLGKGVVLCKDTPNFVANRIGIYAMMNAMKHMRESGCSIQEADAFTGPNIGRPKSATFRTADVVGLDTLVHVAENLYHALAADDEREMFRVPDYLRKMVAEGATGSKSKKGFFIKDKDGEIRHRDLATGEYLSKQKLSFQSIALARAEENAAGKTRAMLAARDKASDFLWKNLSDTFLYCAKRMGEIADNIVQIDNAMQWGFGWELGPFEAWDALGVRSCAGRMAKEGRALPQAILDFLDKGNETFYKREKGVDYYYDFSAGAYREIVRGRRVLLLKNIKERAGTVLDNPGASLIDLGDGVACLEFHTKMNAVGGDIISMAKKAMEETERNFRALVIANQGKHFSAGANLMLILTAILEEEWEEIDLTIRRFQEMNMAFRHFGRPVVAAPFGMTLGGGCEVCLHARQITAHAETYIGLVEAGVGLIPAAGGSKEMLARAMEPAPEPGQELPLLKKVFETLATAKVSASGEDARELGFLLPGDRVIVNGDHLIHYAKQSAIGLAESGFRPLRPRTRIPVTGRPGMAAVKLFINGFREGGFITEHDGTVALKLGHVLTGGNISGRQEVSEQYLLDLEREAFLSLCGMRKTQERIKHMLENGKPLRN